MEEAAHCHRLAILNKGERVALDTPDNLRATIGGDIVTIQAHEPEMIKTEIQEKLGIDATLMDGVLRIEQQNGHALIAKLGEMLSGRVDSMTLSKPTLEDVFIRKTGHKFWTEPVEPKSKK